MNLENELKENRTIELSEEMLSEVTGGARRERERDPNNQGMKCPSCGQLIPFNSILDILDKDKLVCPKCNFVLNIDVPQSTIEKLKTILQKSE